MRHGGRGFGYRQRWRAVVSASLEETFAFLADPRSLPALEPAWTDMRFVPGPARDLGLGSEREYVFRWSGFPVYLRLRVTEFEPPRRLVLEQALGPFQACRRAFTLRSLQAGTAIAEQYDFRAMPGVLTGLVIRLVVARQLDEIAKFHHEALIEHLRTRVSLAGIHGDDS
jgi:hypothetical protein